MDTVDEKRFKEAKSMAPVPPKHGAMPTVSERDFKKMLKDMENPVLPQKEMAVKIKTFLDARIEHELQERGVLSDHTRRWVESYNKLLDQLQRALHGDRSVNLHLHKVSHSQIAAKMRDALEQ